jgi:hypothetical protein
MSWAERQLGRGRVVLRHCDGFCARETSLSNLYRDFLHFDSTDLALKIPIQVQHRNEKYIDCEAAFANHCAIQSIDSLSNQHSTNTNPPHPHWTGQDTNRIDSPMHPHRKSPHISDSPLEKPYRLRLYFSASCPDRDIHHYCFSSPLAVPCSHQFSSLFSHLQERVYDRVSVGYSWYGCADYHQQPHVSQYGDYEVYPYQYDSGYFCV